MTRYPDPRLGLIHLDSCAFDPKYDPEDKASEKIIRYADEGCINAIIAHSARKEIEHPNTPNWVKTHAQRRIFTRPTPLTQGEFQRKKQILGVLTGNGSPDKHIQDATHIFEASKYGGLYFVTTDKRILNGAIQIHQICRVNIVKPSELIQILDGYLQRP